MVKAVEIQCAEPTPATALRIHGQMRFSVYQSVATGADQLCFGERADYDVVYVAGEE